MKYCGIYKIQSQIKPEIIVIAPKKCGHGLTPGKEYKTISTDGEDGINGLSFYSNNDVGHKLFCLERGCAHLNNQNWTTKK